MSSLRIQLLGDLSLAWDQDPLPTIASTAARSLLAYLVTFRDRAHTRDLLAGTFWPDLPDTTARRRLRQALWRIRRTVADLPSPVPFLLTDAQTVQFNHAAPYWLDVDEFLVKAQIPHTVGCAKLEAQTAEPELGVWALEFGRLRDAVALYRGDFLAGTYDDWVLVERERLRAIFLTTLERLIASYKQQGDYETALVHARRLATEDPWREAAHREVMRLCHLLNRDAEALRQFEVCRQVLAEELGVEASAETVALAHEIATREGTTPAVLPEFRPSPAAVLLGDLEAPELPLVGREKERTELLAHVEALFQGLGGIVLVEGEAGVGKTHLLQTVACDAEWRGADVLWAGGREGPATPYGPLITALTEGLSPLRVSQLVQLVEGIWIQALAGLLPPLAAALPDLYPPPQLEPTQDQDRLVTALAHLLAGWAQIAPLLLILEDLHWANKDALDLLVRLAPSLGEHAVLLVGSYRSGQARALTETWQQIQALDRAGVKHKMALYGLDAAATGELVRRSLGMGSPAPVFESRLYQETQGNPLFVLETLRALYSEGLLSRDQDGQWCTPWDETTNDYAELPLPRAVEQTIARRLATIPPALKQTIRLAAVLGERFDFALLRAASKDQPSTLLADLRDLVQRRFVNESDQDYHFSHAKIHQVIYEDIGALERAHLHRQAAQAFETLQPGRVATLAYHWMEAEVWDRAAEYHQQAGDQARAVYANTGAAEHYTQALAALDHLSGSLDLPRLFQLRSAREAVYALQGDRQMQAEDLSALEELAQTLDGDAQPHAVGSHRAQVSLRRAKYAEATGDYAAVITAAQAAIDLARASQMIELEAAGHLQWGLGVRRQGDYDAALSQFNQALTLAQTAGLPQVEADSLRSLGIVSVYQGHYSQAQTCLERALHVYQEIGDRRGEGETLNNLGAVFDYLEDYAEARTNYERSLRVCREIGYRRGEGDVLNNLGLVADVHGDYDGAIAYYTQCLHIYREIGHRQGEGWLLGNLAFIFDVHGDHDRAISYLEKALCVHREIGDRQGEGTILADMGLFLHHLGDHNAAQQCCQQAILIAQELGSTHVQGHGLTNLGHALAGLGHLVEASDAYQQALTLRREVEEHNLAIESLAGLARVSLAQGHVAQALSHVERIFSHLEAHNLYGTYEPFRIYLTCYRVFQASEDPRAEEILTTAYCLLQERAANIEDEALRRSFLENVTVHRELVAAARELQARKERGCIKVRLPRADAPTTRPLTPDEWVQVVWTVDAPEDAQVPRKTAHRQGQLLRLLRQAEEQGAAPTIEDLAAALQVSRATIKRDLAVLRRAGFEPRTRGSKK